MSDRSRPWHDKLRFWLASPFVALPAILLVIALWPQDTPQPPIFDVQLQYNDEAWRVYTVNAITKGLARHNVIGALVTSVPNEGTERLTGADRNRLYPLLTPLRTRADHFTWFQDPEVVAYVQAALRSGEYRGIGEFNVTPEQARTPLVKELVTLVARTGLLIASRSDVGTIHELFTLEPGLRVLWAPAGTSAGVDTIEALLRRYPTLWIDLSRHAVAPDGVLDPLWRDLFMRFPQRFMVGTGTYTSVAWYYFRYMLGDIRKWLLQLPPDVAERIAYRNAQELMQTHAARA